MGLFSAIGTIVGGAGGFIVGGPAGAAAGASLGGSIGGGIDAGKASKKASRAQVAGLDRGISEQRRQFDINQQNFRRAESRLDATIGQAQPFIDTGQRANSALERILLDGDASLIEDSPIFRLAADEASEAVNREASAAGMLGSGRRIEALRDVNFNAASSLIDRYFQLSGRGQDAVNSAASGAATAAGVVSNEAAAGSNTAANISNLFSAQGDSRASAILGKNTARQTALEGILSGVGTLFGGNSGNLSFIDTPIPQRRSYA